MSVCMCSCTCIPVPTKPEWAWIPLLELRLVVSQPMWVLEMEFRPCRRSGSPFNLSNLFSTQLTYFWDRLLLAPVASDSFTPCSIPGTTAVHCISTLAFRAMPFNYAFLPRTYTIKLLSTITKSVVSPRQRTFFAFLKILFQQKHYLSHRYSSS